MSAQVLWTLVVLCVVVSVGRSWLITMPSPPLDEGQLDTEETIAQRDIRKTALQNSELGKTLINFRQNTGMRTRKPSSSGQPYSDNFWNSLLQLLEQRKAGATTEPPSLKTTRVTFAGGWNQMLYPENRIALGPWIMN
ncbi:uncharacterized protein LOC129591155 [Paramacrobiotus metropolitanus]|uniref:uncharacterized protein LOC129591155 n=1 Tax=Paramacrobiotus metropolitanus TaxID=2943436 RepID=UPI002445A758|nr:uncharacterized protein LOC129591155 [Paramacrobiotus metropolitanus]